MVVFALANFGMIDLSEIGRMTLNEFRLRKQAYKVKLLDREESQHWQAFLERKVNQTTPDGKNYKYPDFKSFYNSEKRRSEVLGKVEQDPVSEELIARARRLQKLRKEE